MALYSIYYGIWATPTSSRVPREMLYVKPQYTQHLNPTLKPNILPNNTRTVLTTNRVCNFVATFVATSSQSFFAIVPTNQHIYKRLYYNF